MGETLRVREWLAVAIACGALSGLAALTTWRSGYSTATLPQSEQIDVLVTGAVTAPGSYRVSKERAVTALIALTDPLPEADLQKPPKLLPPSPLSEGKWRLIIPSQNYVEIEVSGAVKTPALYRLPPGSRLSDLPTYVEMEPTADRRWLRRRRLLRSGDQVVVPISSKNTKAKTLS